MVEWRGGGVGWRQGAGVEVGGSGGGSADLKWAWRLANAGSINNLLGISKYPHIETRITEGVWVV